MLFFLTGIFISENERALASDNWAEIHDAINLSNLCSILRLARFKQFGYTRQTASNILSLGSFPRCLSQQSTGGNLVTFIHRHVGAGRDRVIRHGMALGVFHNHLRMEIFLVLDDHHGFLTGGRIQFVIHGHTLDNIVEYDLTTLLRENRHVVRIPLHKGLAFLDGFTVRHRHYSTYRDIIILNLRVGLGIVNTHAPVLVQNNVTAVFKVHNPEALVLDHTTFTGADFRLLKDRGRGTSNVEGPHGQLSARLSN